MWLNDVKKNILPSTNALCDRCSSVFSCTAEHRFVGGICLSHVRVNMHSRVTFFPRLYKDKRVTLNKKQKNEISNSAAFITGTNQVLWSVFTNTIPHGRAIMYMVTPATEASMMAVGHFAKILDLERKDGS